MWVIHNIKSIAIISVLLLLAIKLVFNSILPLSFAFIVIVASYNTVLRFYIIEICLMVATYYLVVFGLNIFYLFTIVDGLVLMLEDNPGGADGQGSSGPSGNIPGGPNGPNTDPNGAVIGGANSSNNNHSDNTENGQETYVPDLHSKDKFGNLAKKINLRLNHMEANVNREVNKNQAAHFIDLFTQLTKQELNKQINSKHDNPFVVSGRTDKIRN